MSTHARLEVYCADERAEEIAAAIVEAAYTGEPGDGIVAVVPVESMYRIRSREAINANTGRREDE